MLMLHHNWFGHRDLLFCIEPEMCCLCINRHTPMRMRNCGMFTSTRCISSPSALELTSPSAYKVESFWL
jgi:hypothetical protein